MKNTRTTAIGLCSTAALFALCGIGCGGESLSDGDVQNRTGGPGSAGYQDGQTKSPVPVYYLGSQDIASKLEENAIAVTHIDSNARSEVVGRISHDSKHILILDGDYPIEAEFLREEILSGNPVIALGQPDKIRGLFEDQLDAPAGYSAGPDGTLQAETGYGYYQSPAKRVATWQTGSRDIVDSIQGARNWAIEALHEEEVAESSEKKILASTPDGAYFAAAIKRDWQSNDMWKPIGRLNIRNHYQKVANDGNSAADFWVVTLTIEMIPGSALYARGEQGYANTVFNKYVENTIDVNHKFPFELLAREPGTTDGRSSVSVGGTLNISTSPSVGLGKAWGYYIGDMIVTNNGDYSLEKGKWKHEVSIGNSSVNVSLPRVAFSSMEVKPVLVMQTKQGLQNPIPAVWELYSVRWIASSFGAWKNHDFSVLMPPYNLSKKSRIRNVGANKPIKVQTLFSSTDNRDTGYVSLSTDTYEDYNKFQLLAHGDQTYSIKSVATGKCLDVPYGTQDPVNIVQYRCDAQDKQKFYLILYGSGSNAKFAIKAKHSNKCLSVKNQIGASVRQETCNSNDSKQLFKFAW